jgi:hypothetical protein
MVAVDVATVVVMAVAVVGTEVVMVVVVVGMTTAAVIGTATEIGTTIATDPISRIMNSGGRKAVAIFLPLP